MRALSLLFLFSCSWTQYRVPLESPASSAAYDACRGLPESQFLECVARVPGVSVSEDAPCGRPESATACVEQESVSGPAVAAGVVAAAAIAFFVYASTYDAPCPYCDDR